MYFEEKDLENLRKIEYLGTEDTIESLNEDLIESIKDWKEIEKTNMAQISLGYYYLCFLLVRDGLQVLIENVNESTSKNIHEKISKTDEYFKSKMKPKYHHFELDIFSFSLPEEKYFWTTHTIHPIDCSIKITPNTICEFAFKELTKLDNSWKVLEKTYSEKFAKKILHQYRESQVIDPRLKIEYFMWRFLRTEIDMENYTRDEIRSSLNKNPSIHFTKRLFFGLLAQFLDLGKFNKEDRNWALKCLDFFELNKVCRNNYDIYELKRIISNLEIVE